MTALRPGDPAPWFSGSTLGGGGFDLHAAAGRRIIFLFLFDTPFADLIGLLGSLAEACAANADRALVCLVLARKPPDGVMPAIGPGLALIEDYDRSIAHQFGATGPSFLVILDQLLQVVGCAASDPSVALAQEIEAICHSVAHTVISELPTPVLLLPRLFEPELCDLLIDLYETNGSDESGFLRTLDGKTATVIDHQFKWRRDHVIGNPEIQELIRDRIAARLVPALKRYYQYTPTRIDRTIVCCYDAQGHFTRHRDNLLPGTRHRRFALTVGLNDDYESGEIIFPEFGQRGYRSTRGGAIVFSTGMLHEVRPVTKGRRLVFVPFLYDEAGVEVRLADNVHLAPGSTPYRPGIDDIALG